MCLLDIKDKARYTAFIDRETENWLLQRTLLTTGFKFLVAYNCKAMRTMSRGQRFLFALVFLIFGKRWAIKLYTRDAYQEYFTVFSV